LLLGRYWKIIIMNFVELMEFQRAFSAIHLENGELKPKLQIQYENKKGYLIYINGEECSSCCLISIERMVALRGLNLEKWEKYWVIHSSD
jgi:hypothetical protein